MNFLRDELTDIIPHLPEAKSADSNSQYYGRITKAVGYMMMAKLAINAPIIFKKKIGTMAPSLEELTQ